MKRRQFSAMLLTSPLLCSPWLHSLAADSGNRDMPDIEALQQQWRDFVPEGIEVPSPADRLDLNTSQWRSRLNGERFRILRENGTEPAFSSPLDGETRRGIYLCAGCGLPVFTSAMKYDSGTGWPSFFTTIADVFDTRQDFSMIWPRTEYHCVRCGGHHGHIFGDGPPPTGKRWCNNGLSLRFEPDLQAP